MSGPLGWSMKRYRIKVSAESIQRMRNTNILVG
jgi:hypothetical protein